MRNYRYVAMLNGGESVCSFKFSDTNATFHSKDSKEFAAVIGLIEFAKISGKLVVWSQSEHFEVRLDDDLKFVEFL